ncbi:hypothetical protein [Goodfellowiella coeruleoviolacea]|uniref:Uncharacterized protein n=1 Tax=Goodfellowiella coeruleoviolacea TaxID=334858 RepID=A0AAE3GE01_9PSEU|nr:hypothetical protein [Goodfellowiella coeruleoviolacea]MCP2166405.1 hypothetical protein [Goodfellowiella coeruleoviolacea]
MIDEWLTALVAMGVLVGVAVLWLAWLVVAESRERTRHGVGQRRRRTP